ncbi:MAG: cation diffusion facilitator family transporter, partial [Clostridia bacterium]|nr:cation diffusion facilitator family transporter [Clostridia bacterium]
MDRLFRIFIKDAENVKEPKVRDAYGRLAGIVGIISNLILSGMKVLIGTFSGSIAIVADGINNLADAGSSIVTLIGFKLASLPEDEEHPYGHARIEYIAGMIVSMIIILVGFELGKSSVDKIIHPEALDFSITVVVVLVLSIIIKFLQSRFNVAVGKKINSVALMATAADSRNDVISTAVVLLSTLVGHFMNIKIDGYMGLLVSLFIIYAGISLTKETVSPLLGEAPEDELVKAIEDGAMAFPGVLGIHDLVVHNYGPGKVFASVHIEVDSRTDIMESHDLTDRIEMQLRHDLGIFLTCHMDPLDMTNPHRAPLSELLTKEIKDMEGVINFHDLRLVPGPTHTNVIFDILMSPECKIPREEITKRLSKKINEYNNTFFTV